MKQTAAKVAESLNGKEYPLRLCREDQELLKANGLVVVTGNSDDLISFYGAIYDEAGVYDGGEVLIDNLGVVDREENASRLESTRVINAIWCGTDAEGNEVTWSYNTDIKHETFNIVEDGGVYCVGMVFRLDDLKPSLSQDDLKKHLAEHMREAEVMAYEYFKNCEVGEERVKAGLAYENIRNALRVG